MQYYHLSLSVEPNLEAPLDALLQQWLDAFEDERVKAVLPLNREKVGKFDPRPNPFLQDCALTRALPGRISGSITFSGRYKWNKPGASRDADKLSIRFDSRKVDLSRYANEMFPALIELLNPYLAELENLQASANRAHEGPWHDKHEFGFIGNAFFANAHLLRDATGMAPDTAIDALTQAGIECYAHCGGVVIVTSREPLEDAAARELSDRTLTVLGVSTTPKPRVVPGRETPKAPPQWQSRNDVFRTIAEYFTGVRSDADEIALPEKLDRSRLDFSLESLKHVDEYLTHVRARRKQLTDEEWHYTVLRAGAYVGEVIRTGLPPNTYNWVDLVDYAAWDPEIKKVIPEPGIATCALLVSTESPGRFLLPLNKIARFIEEGPENSVHYFAACEF